MEPVDKGQHDAQLSVLQKAWLSAMQEQEGHATRNDDEHARAYTIDALHRQQQASFLSLIRQRQQTQQNREPAHHGGAFRTTHRGGHVSHPRTIILPNTQHSFPATNVLPTQVATIQSLPTMREENYPFHPPQTPLKRGMVPGEASQKHSSHVPSSRSIMPSITPPTAAIYTHQHRYIHQRNDSSGMVSSSTTSSPPSPSTSVASGGSIRGIWPPIVPPTTPQVAPYTDQQRRSYQKTHSTGVPAVSAESSPAIQSRSEPTHPAHTNPSTMAVPPDLVHQACELYSQMDSIVKSAVQVDPTGVNRRLSTCHGRCKSAGNNRTSNKRQATRSYDYPINIALHHSGSFPVIQLLVDTGPKILVEQDGPEDCCALSCALLNKRRLNVISLLVNANTEQAKVCDRYKNYPLHTACASGACLEVVKLITSTFPEAVAKRNFHGQTPLDIAQRNVSLKDDVIDYLQQISFGGLEQDAIHLDDDAVLVNDADVTNRCLKRESGRATQA